MVSKEDKNIMKDLKIDEKTLNDIKIFLNFNELDSIVDPSILRKMKDAGFKYYTVYECNTGTSLTNL